MEYKILEWNINQATDRYGRNNIPNFVRDELISKSSDIVILTEFCFCNNAEVFLKEAFESNGYDYNFTNNKEEKQNEILIAWKKELFKFQNKEAVKTTNLNNKPNCLIVNLIDNNGKNITVVGLRITIKSYRERKEQMTYVLEKIKDYDNVIIGGDFNNLRRGASIAEWNLNVIEELCEKYNANLYTPTGQSIYQEQGESFDYEFPEDHFITKGNIQMKEYTYNREFTRKNPDVYLFKGDFQVYNNNLKRVTWSIPFGSGIPDHAILQGKFEL
ncbi:hypothetical protein [Caldifermentibacillus hisashii]|uniref:hypothetical protein n=1 Tax=Caldifermentibacillus hisashii TaxID=996558 RepID=UPI003100DCF0